MNELFAEIPESKPSRLVLARIAAERAQARYDECERLLDEQGVEAMPELDKATRALTIAEDELKAAELEAKG